MSAKPFQPVGLFRTDQHKYHWNGGPAMPGVTSVMRVIDKSGPLIGWAKGVTADAALDNLGDLTDMVARDGRAPTRAWLVAHATEESDKAKDLGTRIHILAEKIARGEKAEVSELEWPFVRAYLQYQKDWKPDFRKGRSSLERYVANLTYGYGGTFDFVCHLDLGDGPKLTLGDLKTGKGVYPESRLQLAALGMAEFIGMPDDPKQYAMPKIEQYVILHVRPDAYPDGYKIYRVGITDFDRKAFLYALGLHRYMAEGLPKGDPIANPMTNIEVDAA